MATQCWPFVSSSVYHGYVQTPAAAKPPAQQRTSDTSQDHDGMDVDSDGSDKHQQYQAMIVARAQEQRARKRNFEALPRDFDYEDYVVPRFKRFREEAVVTNVFSMVQGTGSGHRQINVDWPRCTMSRYYA